MADTYQMDANERENLLAPIAEGAALQLYVNYMNFHDPEDLDAVSLKDAKLFDISLFDETSGEMRPVTPMKEFEDCLGVIVEIIAAHGDRIIIDRESLPSEVVEHIDTLVPAPTF